MVILGGCLLVKAGHIPYYPQISSLFFLSTTQLYLRAPETGRGLPDPSLSLHMASNVAGLRVATDPGD